MISPKMWESGFGPKRAEAIAIVASFGFQRSDLVPSFSILNVHFTNTEVIGGHLITVISKGN